MKARTRQLIITAGVAASLLAPTLAPAAASAHAEHGATTEKATASDRSATTQNSRLSAIKTKGDAEIARRLAALNKLIATISDADQLGQNTKDSLSTEVSNEITALTALRAKLSNETTVEDAAADVAAMVSEYRVYALIVPKVRLIRTAADQQAAEQKLDDLHTKLADRLSAARNSGKNVTTLQTKLDEMASHIAAAQSISTSVEASVLALQPTDYNSDHRILGGYRDQLKTARSDIQAAFKLAKEIVTGLKQL